MTAAKLAKRINPRVVILVGLALAAVVVLRRARGDSGAPEIIDPGTPLGGIPAPGFGEDGFAEDTTGPYTLPFPAQGGIVVIPGFDPIIWDPDEEAPAPAPAPGAPKPKSTRGAWFGGQFWTPSERKEFRSWWTAKRRRNKKPAGEGAWERWLADHPGFAKALGFPVIPRRGNPATIPNPATQPQASSTSSARDVGTGGQTLAAAPGNRLATVQAPRVIHSARPAASRILPHTPATRPGARLERRRRRKARR